MKTLIWMVVVLMLLPSCYVTKQAYRQFGLIVSRQQVAKVIESKNAPEVEKAKLRFSQAVLEFAKVQGLSVGSAYETYVQIPGRAVTYTVQAAKPTEMKLKQWWFPFVGSVPYLGFFDEADRAVEASRLKKEGYEVHEGSATAFSSLGWFSDPIYSSMLKRADVELAHLYFHELTHRTIWLQDGVEFNENLAEFVGDTLTEKFFRIKSRDQELVEFNEANADYLSFRDWLKALRHSIEVDLAASAASAEEERIARKNKVIALAISQKPRFKRFDFVGSNPWNNARILAAGLYTPDTKNFETAWGCFLSNEPSGHMGGFLKKLKVAADKTGNGFQALETFCAPMRQGA